MVLVVMVRHSCVKVRTVKVLRRLLFALILFSPAFLLMANPAPRVDSIDALEGGAKLHAVIDRVVESQHAVRTLQADFVLIKRSELLLEAIESSGVFLYRAPDLVRWNYLRPDSMVVLFSDDTVTTYHPQQSRAERLKEPRRASQGIGQAAPIRASDGRYATARRPHAELFGQASRSRW
jgi:outer membrane lipoprotein-sorting protein